MRREITYITCTPCEERTGKEVEGERIVVDGVIYDVCEKDRKPLDRYLEFRERYGQQSTRATHNGSPKPPRTPSTAPVRRYVCGACRKAGEDKEVAHASRSWHAGLYHDGAKASEIEWYEV